MENRKFNKIELEERLIKYSVLIIKISESLPNTRAGNHLAGQMVRSGTSPALNYGEVQDAESHKDFIHKLKIILKELRETLIALKIVSYSKIYNSGEDIEIAIKESNELISIFVKSVSTMRKNTVKK